MMAIGNEFDCPSAFVYSKPYILKKTTTDDELLPSSSDPGKAATDFGHAPTYPTYQYE